MGRVDGRRRLIHCLFMLARLGLYYTKLAYNQRSRLLISLLFLTNLQQFKLFIYLSVYHSSIL